MREEKPILMIYAGPNGSGKSSLTKLNFEKDDMPSLYINADDITREKLGDLDINSVDKELLNNLNIEAANEADRLRQEAIKAGQSFATETVMSTPSKIDLMRQAKKNGYDVHLVYVTTQDPKINIARVQNRVDKGGHSVPPEKTEARYERAMRLLPEAIQVANTAKVYNNSFENPLIIMEKTIDNEIKLYPLNPPNESSKWTQEKLEEIKQHTIKLDDRFRAIEVAQAIKDLPDKPHLKDLYNAYAKDSLAANGGYWTDKTNRHIAENMLKHGVSPYDAREALRKHSPRPVENVCTFVKGIERELVKNPDMKVFQKAGLKR